MLSVVISVLSVGPDAIRPQTITRSKTYLCRDLSGMILRPYLKGMRQTTTRSSLEVASEISGWELTLSCQLSSEAPSMRARVLGALGYLNSPSVPRLYSMVFMESDPPNIHLAFGSTCVGYVPEKALVRLTSRHLTRIPKCHTVEWQQTVGAPH